jgi:hypothetical protein
VVADGQQSTTGQLSLSGDGQYLFLTGYDSNPLPIATAPELHYVNSTSRAVARIAFDGTVQTIGFVAGPITGGGSPAVQTGGNINGVYSPDGNQFYVSGSNGIDYFANFNPTPDLQTFGARIALTNFTVNGLESDGSNLFAIGGTGAGRMVGQVGTGFPTGPASIAGIPGFPGSDPNTAPFPVDAYFTHLDGPGAPDGINTVYVAEDGPSFARGTITKWSFDGTTWTLIGTVQADGSIVISFYWLTGQTTGNTVTLFATYGNGGNGNLGRGDLYEVVDGAGYGQGFSSTVATIVATVDGQSLENFRGVAFGPVATPRPHLSSDINPSLAGKPVTLTVIITGGATPPTGTVSLYEGNLLIATAILDASSQATLQIAGLAVGDHFLTAYYAGSSVYAPASSEVYDQTVVAPGPRPGAPPLDAAFADDLAWLSWDGHEWVWA